MADENISDALKEIYHSILEEREKLYNLIFKSFQKAVSDLHKSESLFNSLKSMNVDPRHIREVEKSLSNQREDFFNKLLKDLNDKIKQLYSGQVIEDLRNVRLNRDKILSLRGTLKRSISKFEGSLRNFLSAGGDLSQVVGETSPPPTPPSNVAGENLTNNFENLSKKIEDLAKSVELLDNELSTFYKNVPKVGTFFETIFYASFGKSFKLGAGADIQGGQLLKDAIGRVFFEKKEWDEFTGVGLLGALKKTFNLIENSIVESTNLSNYERRLFLTQQSKLSLWRPIFSRLTSIRELDFSKEVDKALGTVLKEISAIEQRGGATAVQQEIDNEVLKAFGNLSKKFTNLFSSTTSEIGSTIAKNIGFFGKGTEGLEVGDIFYELLNKKFFKGGLDTIEPASSVLVKSLENFSSKLEELGANADTIDNQIDDILKIEKQIRLSNNIFGIFNRVLGRLTAGFLGIDIRALTNNFKDMSKLKFSELKKGFSQLKFISPFANVPVVGKETLDFMKKESGGEIGTSKGTFALNVALRAFSGFFGIRKQVSELYTLMKGGTKAYLQDLYGGTILASKGAIALYNSFLLLKNTLFALIKILLITPFKFLIRPLAVATKQVFILSAAIAGLATAASIAYAAIYFGLLKPIIESAKVAEQRFTRLASALQNSIQAVQEYQKAIQFAARTPFLISQVADAAAMLRAFQFDPFAKVGESGRTLLEILGDMAGAMGTDLETATSALIRAQVGEWEIMQNNFQISARMIPQLKGLASGTKEYGDTIVQFLDKQKRFLGGLFLMSQSIQGMQSNIKDFFGVILEYATGVVDSQGLLRGVTFVDEYKEFLRGIYYIVTAKDIGTNIQNIKLMSESTSFTIRRLGQLFSEQFNKMGNDVIHLYNLTGALSNQMEGYPSTVKYSFQDIRKYLEPMLDEFNKLNDVEKENFFYSKMLTGIMGKFTSGLKEGTKEFKDFKLGMADVLLYGNNLTVVLGRLVGIGLSIVMKLFYPVKRLFEFIFLSVRKATLQFLDWIVPLEKIMSIGPRLGEDFNKSFNQVAESVVRSMGKSFSITADQFSRFKDRLLQFNRDYTMSLADISKNGANRLIASMTTLERWIMVVAIVAEFVKLYIEDLFDEIWKKTEWFRKVIWEIYSIIGKFVFDVFSDISKGIFEGIENAFNVDVFKDFLESIRDLILAITNVFRDAFDIGEEQSKLKSISKLSTEIIIKTIQIFVRIITLFVKLLTWIVKQTPESVLKVGITIVEYILTFINKILDVFGWILRIETPEDKKEMNKKLAKPEEKKEESKSLFNFSMFSQQQGMPISPKRFLSMFFPILVFGGAVIKGFFMAFWTYLKSVFSRFIIAPIKAVLLFFSNKFQALKNFVLAVLKDPKILGEKIFEWGKSLVKFLLKSVWGFIKFLFKPIKAIAGILLKPFKWLADLLFKSKEERQLERLRRKYEKLCPFADRETLDKICGKYRKGPKGKKHPHDRLDLPAPIDVDTSKPTKKPTKRSGKFGRFKGVFKGGLGMGLNLGLMLLPSISDYFFQEEEEDTEQKKDEKIKSDLNKKKNEMSKIQENKNKGIQEKATGILEFFKSTFFSLEGILSLLSLFGGAISKFLTRVGLGLARKFIEKGISWLLIRIFGRLLAFIGGMFIPGAGWVLNIILIIDLLDDIFNLGIKDKLAEIWGNITKHISLEKVKKIFEDAWNALKDWWNKLVGFFQSKKDETAKEANKTIKKGQEEMKSKKKGIVETMWNYVKDAWDSIVNWVKNFFSSKETESETKKVLADEKTQKSMLERIREFFEEMFSGMGEWIKKVAEDFKNSMNLKAKFFGMFIFETLMAYAERNIERKDRLSVLRELGKQAFGIEEIEKEIKSKDEEKKVEDKGSTLFRLEYLYPNVGPKYDYDPYLESLNLKKVNFLAGSNITNSYTGSPVHISFDLKVFEYKGDYNKLVKDISNEVIENLNKSIRDISNKQQTRKIFIT